jgi:hypothetical protein
MLEGDASVSSCSRLLQMLVQGDSEDLEVKSFPCWIAAIINSQTIMKLWAKFHDLFG